MRGRGRWTGVGAGTVLALLGACGLPGEPGGGGSGPEATAETQAALLAGAGSTGSCTGNPARCAGVTLAAGDLHTLAVKADGTAWAWGADYNGQLGDNAIQNRLSPVPVSGLTGVVAVAGTSNMSFALKADGTVWAWGDNGGGLLGDGTTIERHTPVQLTSLSGVVAIAAGGASAAALKSDGTLWTWGYNYNGQLGDGTTTNRTTPTRVTAISGVTAVVLGGNFALVLKSDGTVWGWGNNGSGQLGDGTTTNRLTPVQVTGLSGVTAISGGSTSSMALRADGTVWGWGRNNYGQLGDGTTTNRLTPVQVPGLSGVVAVRASPSEHTLAIRSDGTVWTWGRNDWGELGDGTRTSRATPAQVSGVSGAVAVTSGMNYSVVARSDGALQGWGMNGTGALGNGTTATAQVSPAGVVGLNLIPPCLAGVSTCGATGVCAPPPVAQGTACDDGNPSTAGDVCTNGTCAGVDHCLGVVCAPLDTCHTAGTCIDHATGACSNPPRADGAACDDGDACTQTDTCQAGVCKGSQPVTCAAPDQCHAAGTCQPQTGTCSQPALPDGTACDDGDPSTTGEVCTAGVCAAVNHCLGVTCAAQDACHLSGTCDPLTGACSNPAKPDGAACDDGNACTQGDACQAGVCAAGAPVTCAAQDACHLAGTCDPLTGACSNPPNPACTPTCITIQRGVLGAVSDALINAAAPSKSYGSSQSLTAAAGSVGLRHGLLRFDLSPVPPGATITSATLRLTVMLAGGEGPLALHRITAPWSEASVSWSSFAGAFSPTVEAAMPAVPLPTADLRALVQGWVSGSAPNHGVLIERTADGTTILASSEFIASQQPRLDVCYTP